MTDPEIAYRRLTSGDPGAVRDRADTLDAAWRAVDSAQDGLREGAGTPDWRGLGATAFETRSAMTEQGLQVGSMVLDLARGGLRTAASAYDGAISAADYYIGFWRNRPAALPVPLEEVLARMVQSRIEDVGRHYDQQLGSVVAVLAGDPGDIDLDALDSDTRDWVEDGLESTENWNENNNSSFGPQIPNTQAWGDGRNLTPQGLGYDPSTGLLVQSYDDADEGDHSGVALINESTGQEVGEAMLGGGQVPGEDGTSVTVGQPGHVGGVTVDGNEVLVSSDGKVYSYPLDQLQNAQPGEPVEPTRADPVDASSYTTMHDGQLYVGDFDNDVMHVYDRKPGGGWTPATDENGDPLTIDTPPRVQGAVVRDGEIVYSTSEGRTNLSQMVVTDRDGEVISRHLYPNMSEGIVETEDGDLITTYESGAQKYDHYDHWWQRFGGPLWASPYMTRTPIESLIDDPGLELSYPTLIAAAGVLGDPVADLRKAAGELDGFAFSADLLGEVPTAPRLSSMMTTVAQGSADSARVSSSAVDQLAGALRATVKDHQGTDLGVSGLMRGLTPS